MIDIRIKKQLKGSFANMSVSCSSTQNPFQQTESDEELKNRDIQRSLICPWISTKIGFLWSKYLDYNKAKSAPTRAFYIKDPFPYQKNLFRVGMKMEAIDPVHQSYFCVVTVAEIQGYRLRLHFDNYSDVHDFWVNIDSTDIKPVGFCERNNHTLHPPKGYNKESFNWAQYLKECKSPFAPKIAFAHILNETVCPSGFRIGMKLEAVDRKNSNLICVASIADILDTRVLIHFDSWDEIYDYWVEPSSPYIHPVGWCKENGCKLTPPSNYTDPEKFSWESYLKETKSAAGPARAFKNRPSSQFREGMKLEAVDKRVPFLVRVATIQRIDGYELRISFDGWPDRYSFWVDDDSPDIHPVGWCSKTGHALEPPLIPADLELPSDCGTPGCIGLGNINDVKRSRHRTEQDCPYALSNMGRGDVPDRFSETDLTIAEAPILKSEVRSYGSKRSRESSTSSISLPKQYTTAGSFDNIKMKPESLSKDEEGNTRTLSNTSTKTYTVKERSSSSECRNDGHISVNDTDDESPLKKIRLNQDEVSDMDIESSITQFSLSGEVKTKINDEIKNELKTSVFEPSFIPFGNSEDLWVKYSEPLQYTISMRKRSNPRTWSATDVAEFVNQIPNCSDYGKLFKKQGIDGESFLLFKQQDLLSCGLKLGPALKVYNAVNMLRNIMKTKLVA